MGTDDLLGGVNRYRRLKLLLEEAPGGPEASQ